jgi:hypothetical protein
MKKTRSIINEQPIILLILFIIGFSSSVSCRSSVKGNGEPQLTAAPEQKASDSSSAPVVVKITSIDDKPLKPKQTPEVGRQVTVEGTISDPKMIACVVVHPMSGTTWWVQNLPGPRDKVGKQAWRVRSNALCGTNELGTREEYEIVILAESKPSFCVEGKKFETPDFPNDLARSELLRVKRTRD